MSESLPYPRKKRPRQGKNQNGEEWVYAIPCPQCGEARWLKRSDAQKAIKQELICKNCSNRIKGRLGYAASALKYGKHFALKRYREWRMANPSSLERRIIELLEQLQIRYEREVICESEEGRCFLIDFVVQNRQGTERIAIEVNGYYYHSQREEADAEKAEEVRKAGYQLLIIEEEEIKKDKAKGKIIASIGEVP